MKNSSKHAKKLSTLLRKLTMGKPRKEPEGDDLVGVLVYSFLLWESTSSRATASYGKLLSSMEDYNELRVSMPNEIIEMIGDTTEHADERASRLRASLNAIYLREHDVTLDAVVQQKKAEIRDYIESLDGIVPFVSARVLSRCFDVHAIPVDDQLLVLLEEAEVIEPDCSADDVSKWLTRQIGAEQGEGAQSRFQGWVDSESRRIIQNRQRREKAAQKHRDQRIKERQKERVAEAKERRLEREEAARKRAAKAAAKAEAARRAEEKKAAKLKEEKKAAKLKEQKKTARKKAAKKTTKKKVAKKKVAKKKVAKKKTAKKKVAKKKVARKKVARKKTAKKTAKKKVRKKTPKRR
ncbi:MAG: hypothetical protein P8K80_05815 [Phycisphaerales bacterium]|nr:hypothetical protein [Phycisphaerales bacterium]